MKTNEEIAEIARRLTTFLDDEGGWGMFSWQQAVSRVGRELYDALGEKLGLPS